MTHVEGRRRKGGEGDEPGGVNSALASEVPL